MSSSPPLLDPRTTKPRPPGGATAPPVSVRAARPDRAHKVSLPRPLDERLEALQIGPDPPIGPRRSPNRPSRPAIGLPSVSALDHQVLPAWTSTTPANGSAIRHRLANLLGAPLGQYVGADSACQEGYSPWLFLGRPEARVSRLAARPGDGRGRGLRDDLEPHGLSVPVRLDAPAGREGVDQPETTTVRRSPEGRRWADSCCRPSPRRAPHPVRPGRQEGWKSLRARSRWSESRWSTARRCRTYRRVGRRRSKSDARRGAGQGPPWDQARS